MLRAAGALALLLLLTSAPAARAEGPLGPGAPCKVFDDPNDPNATQDVIDAMAFQNGFPVEEGCEKLCKKARSTCAKHVKRAFTCNRNSIDDSAFFQAKVTCAGQTGSTLKTCTREVESESQDERDALDVARDTALAACDDKAEQCVESCDAP